MILRVGNEGWAQLGSLTGLGSAGGWLVQHGLCWKGSPGLRAVAYPLAGQAGLVLAVAEQGEREEVHEAS